MLERYLPAFAAMQPEAVAYAWAAAHHRWPHRLPPPPADAVPGEELYSAAATAGLYTAEIAIALAGDPAPLALQSLEQLIGRPLQRAAARAPRAEVDEALRARLIAGAGLSGAELNVVLRTSGDALDALAAAHGVTRLNGTLQEERVRRERKRRVRDPRVVEEVKPNPRKPGTAAWRYYECWKVGDTVDQCIARGLPPRYVGKCTRKGWVRIGSARK